MKLAKFLGDSRDVIGSLPEDARREAGFQIDRIQRGLDPDDWKPMKSVGSGVREIRIREESGAFRVIYLATLAEYVYVLHVFQKKSQATPKRDIELARIRLAMLIGRTKQ
jgi:phage-related protein